MARFTTLLAVCATAATAYGQGSGGEVNVGDIADSVAYLESGALPQAQAAVQVEAYRAAFNASMVTSASVNAQLASLAQAIELVQNNAEQIIQTSVAEALNAQMAQIETQLDGIGSEFNSFQGSLDSATTSVTNSISTAESYTGTIVGWKQCSTTRSSGADTDQFVFMDCQYEKKRNDTILSLTMSTNFRQIDGRSYWQFFVSGRKCEGPNGEANGNLYTGFHGSSSINNHRPMFYKGFCWSLASDANQFIPAGHHHIEWKQTYISADSAIGWGSSSRIMVEEWLASPSDYGEAASA